MDAQALPSTPTTCHSASGFTLLEVLIAFVILSLTLAAVLSALSTGLRSLGSAEEAELAVLRAQSKLEAIGSSAPLAATRSEGEFADGTGWQVVIEPYDDHTEEDEDLASADLFAGRLFQVSVSVTSTSGRRVELRSLRWSAGE